MLGGSLFVPQAKCQSTTADELFEVINEDFFDMKYDGNIASVMHS